MSHLKIKSENKIICTKFLNLKEKGGKNGITTNNGFGYLDVYFVDRFRSFKTFFKTVIMLKFVLKY